MSNVTQLHRPNLDQQHDLMSFCKVMGNLPTFDTPLFADVVARIEASRVPFYQLEIGELVLMITAARMAPLYPADTATGGGA